MLFVMMVPTRLSRHWELSRNQLTKSICIRLSLSAGQRAGFGGWKTMSKESSRHAGTTENTYIDPGATTPEAYEISKTSRTLARKMVGNVTPEDRVRQRCSVAVGDFAMADLLRFNSDPVEATVEALRNVAVIITDIRMVQV